MKKNFLPNFEHASAEAINATMKYSARIPMGIYHNAGMNAADNKLETTESTNNNGII